MVEIQCSSCHTRYRIDERVLPEETPTFKCSRCGHVFSIEPRVAKPPLKHGQPNGVSSKPPADSKAAATKAAAPDAADSPAKPPQSRVRRPLRVVPPSPPREPEAQPEPATPPPQAAAEEPKPPQSASAAGATEPSDTNPLARPFSGSGDEPEAGDSASFDFSSENDEHVGSPVADAAPEEDTCEAGETALEFHGEPAGPPAVKSKPAKPLREAPPAKRREERDFSRDEMPPLGSAVHSSGFFLAWFFFVALGFGALSLLIAGAPSASAALLTRLPILRDRLSNPLPPATRVALRDVHTEYQAINGQGTALVITGQAVNVSDRPLHAVQIAATLLDSAQRQLARQMVFCGNSLSGRIIGQMTARELDFFQKLGPPKTFVLPPSASSAFVIVFAEAPRGSSKLALQVAQAQQTIAAAPDASPTPGM